MKKLSVLKLISLIFVCVMLIGAVAVTALATEGENTVELKKNIILGDKIQLMFAVPTTVPEDAEISVTWGEDNDLTYTRDTAKDFTGYRAYVINEGWAAQNINAMVTITVIDGEDVYKLDYSILMYVYEVINLDGRDETNATYRLCKALLEYAKVADEVINKENANNFDSYYYVEVVDGTIDGNNTWGMFKEGDKPFANISSTKDVGTNQSVEWEVTVEGSETKTYTAAQIVDVEITGKTTVKAVLVDKPCEHNYEIIDVVEPDCTNKGYTVWQCTYCEDSYTDNEVEANGHDWTEATCTAPKTCETCGVTEGEALGHDWINATCKDPKTCDTCGATEGEALGHTTSNGICENCGFKITTVSEWQLVTDATTLQVGDKIIIAAKDYNFAMSTTQNTNNRGQAAITKNKNTVTFGSDVQVFTLVDGNVNGTFGFKTEKGYIYAASSSSNHLKTQTTNNANGSWKITISGGTATIVAQGTNTKNTMQYNQSSSLFSCYSSSQKDVVIYKSVESYTESCGHTDAEYTETQAPKCTVDGVETAVCSCGETLTRPIPATGHQNTTTATVDATCTEAGSVTVTCDDCGETVSTDEIKALGHNIVDGACTRCEYKEDVPHDCTGGDATCTAQAICEICLKPYGELADHDYEDHDNDCTTNNVCSACGDVEAGSAKDHTYENGACVDCGAKDPSAEPEVVLEITKSDFNSTSYAANNTSKTKGGYTFTSNQVMLQSSAMQWQKNAGYITIASNDFVKLELKATAGTYTVTVGGKTVSGTTANGVTTYDLSGLTGQVKISVGSATGKVDYLKFYN